MIPRFLLPLATPNLPHSFDRTIASTGLPRSRCGLSRWNDDSGTSCRGRFVDRDRVVGGVRREARDVILNLMEEIETGVGVIGISVGQDLGDDRAGRWTPR